MQCALIWQYILVNFKKKDNEKLVLLNSVSIYLLALIKLHLIESLCQLVKKF